MSRSARVALLFASLHLLVLVGLLAATDLSVGWTQDDGAYATQVKVIDQTGSWAYPYRHADVDPNFWFAPVSHSSVTDQGTFPYPRHPAWIVALRGATMLFGDIVGLYVLPVLGAVAAALVAGALASRLRPGSFALGYWLVALGPLVVHSQALWAHTWAAALGGAAALIVLAEARGATRWWHPVGLFAVCLALCLIRTEGLLFAAAVALALAMKGLSCDGTRAERVVAAARMAAPAAIAGLAARLIESWWVRLVAPGGPPRAAPPTADAILQDLGYIEAQANGAMRTLIDGMPASPKSGVIALLALGLGLLAAILVRREEHKAGVLILTLAAVGLVLLRTFGEPWTLAGTFLAVPLLVVGIAGWRRSTSAPGEGTLMILMLIYLGAVLATQYPEGGSRDWGGRFLLSILVPATVIAGLTVRDALERAPGLDQRLVRSVLLLVAFLPTVAGIATTRDSRANNESSTVAADGIPADTVLRMPRYLTRVSWRVLPERDWLSVERSSASTALEMLRPGRTDPVALLGPGADRVRAPGYRREELRSNLVIFHPE